MTGGLLELVAKGSQDIFLTGNPSVTFFRSVYKKHTNFSMESVQQTMVGQQKFGETLYCNISRKGDLLAGIILEIDLPKITGLLTDSTIKWIDSIGHYIINNISIEIGGQIIDRQYGEWMEIWNELTLNSEHSDGYGHMVGKGITITEEKTLIIPLQFWFCKNIGLALPLIALQYHEIKIFLKLAEFNELWKKEVLKFKATRDNNANTISIVAGSNTTDFTSIDNANERYTGMKVIWEDDEEENTIDITQNPTNGNLTIALTGTYTSDKTNKNMYIITNIPDKNYEIQDIRLYCDYIYLDTAERKYFSQSEHNYLIEQVQFNGDDDYKTGIGSLKVPLEFNHPCKEILWVNQINIAKSFNQKSNYSDSVNTLGTDNSTNSIKDAILSINGKDRFDVRTADYFRLLVPYQRHTRVPSKFIYVYSFALNPEQNQPSGTCNFSRLDNSELFINLKDGLLSSKVRVYATNYNILRVLSGMGGLAYSN